MTEEFLDALKKMSQVTELVSIMNTQEVEEALERIKRIDECLKKYGDLARVIELAEEMQANIYQCKTVFTIEEAARYVGHTKSLLYKWTSNREITHYKPTGKAIYIDRAELDNKLRTNPIYSYDELDRMNRVHELELRRKKRASFRK